MWHLGQKMTKSSHSRGAHALSETRAVEALPGPAVLQPRPGAKARHAFLNWIARHRLATISALVTAAVILAVWVGNRFGHAQDPLEATLAHLDQSLGDFRPIEARLTGASYRPVVPATRAAAPNADAPLNVRESANAVERAALTAAPAVAARALAKMYLVSRRADRAVEALAPLVSGSHDAGFLSDAAAAYFVRARDGDHAQALDAAARAVEIDPHLVEASFNFALASEALGQYSLAAKAWDRVIELDPASGWAREAAARRANAPKRQSWRSQDETEFRTAVEHGDDEAAARVAERSLADARAFFERSILKAVGERWDTGDRPALIAAVARAEVAGRALARLSADRWPVAVALQLQGLVNRGDVAAGRAACIPALLDAVKLRSTDRWSEAAVRLAQVKTCGVVVPDALDVHTSYVRLYNAASALQPRGDLPVQLAEVGRRSGTHEYFDMQGRALQLEALLLGRQARYIESLDRYSAAAAAFHRAKNDSAETIIAAHIAETDDVLGAHETAWRERSRALAKLHAIRVRRSRFNIYVDAIHALVDQSLNAAALQLFDAALVDMEGNAEAALLLRADRAALLARLGRVDDANADVRLAFSLLPHVGASAPVEAFRRNLMKAQAMVAFPGDPVAAVAVLTELIKTSDPASYAFEAAELFFLRAGAYVAQSDLSQADQDFKRGFDLVEQRQSQLPDHLRPAAFDRTWDAAASAIRLRAVTRNDPWSALTFAERTRAASLTARIAGNQPFEGADAFRRELPPNVAVIFLSALDDALLSWGMAKDAHSFHLERIAYKDLADLASRFRSALESGSRESFDPLGRRLGQMILASHADVLSGASTLVVVPDGPLLAVPFAAIVDPNGRFLIEDRAVVVAPNLRLLRILSSRLRDRQRTPSAVAFGNPRIGPNLPWTLLPLPGAEDEAQKVAATYAGTAVVGAAATKLAFLDALRRYDVVHFAGHAVINTGREESSSLVLAPTAGDAGVLSANEIDRTTLTPGALVVLAACETAAGGIFRGEGLMGLARPFIAAGAGSVVVNIWPLEDDTAVEFSTAFHREVHAGAAPALALQRVQADFASRKRPTKSWAGWVAIGGNE
jgi:CHAT domain-containing protein